MFDFLSDLLGYPWRPEKEIPELKGRTLLVTGGSDGIGKEATQQLAIHNPSRIWMAARNKAKSEAAIAEIRQTVPDAHISFVQLDLTSFASIQAAVATILSDPRAKLHTLILNAGVMACPPGVTKEGYEIQFGTNHMGHALLAQLLLPVMRKTAKEEGPDADVRVVTVSSSSEQKHINERGVHFEDLKTEDSGGMNPFYRYGQSKLANVLFARALADREHEVGSGVKSMVCHPGFIKSNLGRGLIEIYPWLSLAVPLIRWFVWPPFMMTLYQGCKNELWAAFSPEAKSGGFYYPVGVEVEGSDWSRDVELRGRLWEWTQKELAPFVSQQPT
ncbi:MAG: hypothetical protein Q9162_006088 [Coniocarpon cinnabarinum]